MSRWPTLHPRLSAPDVLDELRRRYEHERRIRIAAAFAPGLAEELRQQAADRPFELYEKYENTHFVYWRQVHPFPGPGQGWVGRAQQLVMIDLPDLVSELTGRPHHPPDWDELQFNLLRKGSYLDPHSDHLKKRLAGFVIGLTPENWPADRGGWLTFLEPDMHTVRDRWAPGMDTLDILQFYPLMQWHEIPVLTESHDRLTINGWMSG